MNRAFLRIRIAEALSPEALSQLHAVRRALTARKKERERKRRYRSRKRAERAFERACAEQAGHARNGRVIKPLRALGA